MTDTMAVPAEAAVIPPRKWKAPIAYGAIALLSLVVFGFGSATGLQTTFHVSDPNDFFELPDFAVGSRGAATLLSLIALALAALAAWAAWQRRRVSGWVTSAFGVSVALAMLVWAGAGRDTTNVNFTSMLALGLVAAGPIIFGALAGMVCERSGIINIAIEGQLLAGAFLAALVASATGSPWLGVMAAPVAGAFVGALLSLFAVRYWVDQIVVGVVLNVLVSGLTGYLFSTVFRNNRELNVPPGLEEWPIPVLSKIPVIGPILFTHSPLVYVLFIVVIVLHVMLFKSRWGLRVRAVGEHPKAADTVGIKVNRTRVRNTIFGGAIAGLGGAFFTVAASLPFGKDMTSGKGYIALAAMILGRWSPKGALAAGLLFGVADVFAGELGTMGSSLPKEFVSMIPYLAAIFAVAGIVGHVRPPAAEGTPYKK